MRRASHFNSANLLWGTVAYCDQWAKVMAVYEGKNLRAVIAATECEGEYNVLLIGDDGKMLYGADYLFELGTTKKNMDACFQLYLALRDVETPSYVPSWRRSVPIQLYEIFTHTTALACRHGGFRTIDDASDKIDYAKQAMVEAMSDPEIEMCTLYNYGFEFPDEDSIYRDGMLMHHIGGGVYCDDDGDSWAFE